jgi:hypothetical protein
MNNVRVWVTGDLDGTDPKGNLNATQCGNYLYVGAVNSVRLFNLTTKQLLLTIPLPGFAPRARCVGQQLVIVANRTLYLFDNTVPLAPVLITELDVNGPVIDVLLLERQGSVTAYVLCQNGLRTVTITGSVLVQTATELFDAGLDAGLVVDVRFSLGSAFQVLYVAAVTHGYFFVFDIARDTQTLLLKRVYHPFLPVNFTQAAHKPVILVVGAIFGLLFYDMADPKNPKLINEQGEAARPSRHLCAQETRLYLNLIRILPQTNYAVNVVFGPQNTLTVGKLKGFNTYCARKHRHPKKNSSAPQQVITWQPVRSAPLQSGRLPWDILLVSPTTRKEGKTTVVVPNSSEPLVQLATVSVPRCPQIPRSRKKNNKK